MEDIIEAFGREIFEHDDIAVDMKTRKGRHKSREFKDAKSNDKFPNRISIWIHDLSPFL